MRVLYPILMLEERGGHEGVVQVEYKNLKKNFMKIPNSSVNANKIFTQSKRILKACVCARVCDRGLRMVTIKSKATCC